MEESLPAKSSCRSWILRFTNILVFGLIYSYKFKAAFENNGVFNRVCDIYNLQEPDINYVISTIVESYNEDVIRKTKNHE